MKYLNSHNLNPKLLREAVEFFTSNPGFSRLIRGMIQKYQSLGRWGGSVTLTALKAEEKDALSTFFRRDYSHQQSATISLERFAHALKETRFSEITVLDLLEEIHGQPLLSRAETLAQKEQAKRVFFAELEQEFRASFCQVWLRTIQKKDLGTRLVQQMYERSPEILHGLLLHVLNALCELSERSPKELYRLPVFARRITKDPHGFDPDTERGRLLISALRIINQERNRVAPSDQSLFLTPAEELTELFYSFGLLRDDLWNFVTCTGILASSEDGQSLSYLSRAYHEHVILNLPLREVVRFAKVYGGLKNKPKTQEDRQTPYKVFIVENSGVFSALMDYLEEFRRENNLVDLPNPTLICTHGQFKLASLLLLEKLVEDGAILYYSGDFDPEGLLMANRLIERFQGQVMAWRYGLEEYHASLSNQPISQIRLKKLDGVDSPELISLKEEILRTGLAGYQEGILELLWEDVKDFILR